MIETSMTVGIAQLLVVLKMFPSCQPKPKPEDTKKFTSDVVNKINNLFPDIEEGFSARDIDDTHIYRVKGSTRESTKQLVIIRFCSRLVRIKIFSKKKTISEGVRHFYH